MDKLCIVIPAFNEEANMETVAREWHDITARVNGQSRLVIIDDGSTDSTYARLQALQKELPQLETVSKSNEGHGATVLYGYHYALRLGADFVFQTDSDGQTMPSEFWKFWESRRDYDIQIGFRKGRQDGYGRRIVTKVLKLVLFSVFTLWTADANAPFRLMSAGSLKQHLHRIPEHFNLTNVLLTVLYEKAESRIRYIHITFRPRQGGENSIYLTKIVWLGWQALKDFRRMAKRKKEVF